MLRSVLHGSTTLYQEWKNYGSTTRARWPRRNGFVGMGFFEIEMEIGLWKWMEEKWVCDCEISEIMSIGLGEGSQEAEPEERGERESMEERERKEIIKTKAVMQIVLHT